MFQSPTPILMKIEILKVKFTTELPTETSLIHSICLITEKVEILYNLYVAEETM